MSDRDYLEHLDSLADAVGNMTQEDEDAGDLVTGKTVVEWAVAEIGRLRADNAEQCRLHGLGSQREARQLAVIEEQRKQIERLKTGEGVIVRARIDGEWKEVSLHDAMAYFQASHEKCKAMIEEIYERNTAGTNELEELRQKLEAIAKEMGCG